MSTWVIKWKEPLLASRAVPKIINCGRYTVALHPFISINTRDDNFVVRIDLFVLGDRTSYQKLLHV